MTDNINQYFIADDRSDKEIFIGCWGPSYGVEAAEKAWDIKQDKTARRSAMVMGDIQPYISQIDGSLIESRSKHRTHLRDHNCIEIGNEVKHLTKHVKPLESPPGLKEHLIRAVNDSQRKRSY
jgi:hypothetical protein